MTGTRSIVIALAVSALAVAGPAQQAKDILAATGVRGGLIVHIGCGVRQAHPALSLPKGGDGQLTAALRANDGTIVHGLDADAANVAKARAHIQSLGLAGTVSVEHWTRGWLPHVDGLVDLVVASDKGQVSSEEIARVLAPRGRALVQSASLDTRPGRRRPALTLDTRSPAGLEGWSLFSKPVPREIDEWTHYLRDATNNAVARDEVVGPPRHVQWKAGPVFARHHDTLASVSALVAAGPRIFYIIDEGPTSLMHFPAKWRLVARSASSGVLLWKRPIPTWADAMRAFRSGPPQLPRRLVAVGDPSTGSGRGHVYVTLGLNAPVSQLDAATGKTLKVYAGSEGADEILLCDGVLVLVTFDPEAWASARASGRRGVPPAKSPRRLVAFDADSGKVLWRKSRDEVAGLQRSTLAAGGGRVTFQCGQVVRCVELKTGRDVWRRPIDRQAIAWDGKTGKAGAPKAKKARKPGKRGGFTQAFYAPTLVMAPDHGVVLSADLGTLATLDLKTGEVLWSCRCVPDFRAPADLFLADGLVWAGLFAVEGRDPRTGEVKRKLDITGLLTPGHHPRCYCNKATERFIISDKRGAEFFDLKDGTHTRHNWVRGGCQYGLMPCNGLLYIPSNACCCYPGVQLHGFYALAPAGRDEGRGSRDEQPPRLERGPAHGSSLDTRHLALDTSADWPTFRGDPTRSGASGAAVPTSLGKAWETRVGGKLSTLVVGEGKVVVASVHQRRVTALDAESGKRLWSFVAGGRVDTPPTLHGGLALFGAADGWVYALRASDGELAWRFRAAPADRRIVVDEQLESVWPLHGSVLVLDGVAYAAAGRSCYLDGGIHLYGLEPSTGKKLCEARVVIPNDQDRSGAFIMDGVRPDVLVSDGKYVYLQQLKFDKRLVRQKGLGRHVLCHSGLADDTWFYRTFWRLGYGDAAAAEPPSPVAETANGHPRHRRGSDFPNSYIKHNLRVPFGQLLAFDGEMVCGLQTWMSPGISAGAASKGGRGCMLFGDANQPLAPDKKTDPSSDYPPGRLGIRKAPGDHKWSARLPFQARAMTIAGATLFVAGWPDAAALPPRPRSSTGSGRGAVGRVEGRRREARRA